MTETLTLEGNPHQIRRAIPSDSAELFDFLVPIYAETALQPVSATKLRGLVDRACNSQAAICGLITGEDGIEGSIGLMIETFDYCDVPHVQIKWNAVAPAYRRQNHGARLMRFAKWCYDGLAKEAEPMPLPMFADIMTTTGLEPKIKMMQRNIPQVGALFAWGCTLEGRFDQTVFGQGRQPGRSQGRPIEPHATRHRIPA